jgi:lipid A 3-O-deacylase
LWRRHFGERFYGQVGVGLAVHDGVAYNSELHGRTDTRPLGSRVLFQEEASLGLKLTPRWALEATYVHISNAHLWTKINPGMDDVGGRLVYRWGASAD